MKKVLTSILFSITLLFSGEPVDVLFYLQDAGETYAMIPVIEALKKQDVSVKVLAKGVAAQAVPPEFPQVAESELPDGLSPKLVVTGVAHLDQGSLLTTYRLLGLPVLAYWDNFSSEGESPYFQTARRVAAQATQVLVPTFALERAFPQGAKTVGQPTLENWVAAVSSLDRNELRQRLGICSCKEIITWIGGYGPAYEEALKLFVASVEESQSEGFYILVQPHPKVKGGEVESEAFATCSYPYRVLQGELTTQEAVALSDEVLCHQSTVAFQAAAAGKPVIYFIPPSQVFTSILLEKGVAQRVGQPGEFLQALAQTRATSQTQDFFKLIGTPRDSVSLIVGALLEYLE
jgi:hypothetical protein